MKCTQTNVLTPQKWFCYYSQCEASEYFHLWLRKLISDNACIPSIVGMVGSEISNHMDISVIDLVFVIQSQSSQTQRLI